MIQLRQALSSGILQGEELRSIREQAPLVAQAIAQEMGVTIGKLKELGAEGEDYH
jgi:tape measure domain-containing protein